MKTKKYHKKLVLNKKTIVRLGNGELKVVDGGDGGTVCATGESPTCITFNGYTCNTCAGYSNCLTCPITGYPVCEVCAYPV